MMNEEPTPEDVVGEHPGDDDLMTVEEVAIYFRVGERMVARWLKKGLIPGAFRLGGPSGWRIPRSGVRDLRRQFAEQKVVKSSDPHYKDQLKRGTI